MLFTKHIIKTMKDVIMEKIKIGGMSCQHCVGSVKKALEAIEGLSEVEVNLEAGLASFVNQGVAPEVIKNAISKIGFTPED